MSPESPALQADSLPTAPSGKVTEMLNEGPKEGTAGQDQGVDGEGQGGKRTLLVP